MGDFSLNGYSMNTLSTTERNLGNSKATLTIIWLMIFRKNTMIQGRKLLKNSDNGSKFQR